jgi:hypothetical protein
MRIQSVASVSFIISDAGVAQKLYRQALDLFFEGAKVSTSSPNSCPA